MIEFPAAEVSVSYHAAALSCGTPYTPLKTAALPLEQDKHTMTKRRLQHSVYQRATDNRWCAALRVPDRPRPIVRYARTRPQAERLLAQMVREHEAGLIHAAHLTLSEYLQGWLRDTKRGEVGPVSLALYTNTVRQYFTELGRTPLQSLSVAQVRAVLNAMRDRGLAPKTVHGAHTILKAALAQAVRDGLLLRNPAAAVRLPTLPARRPTYWTPEQARTFLEAVRDTRWCHLWTLALYTGMRRGELLALHWADVDLDRGVLTVRGAAKRYGGKLHISTTKTEGSAAEVWLPQGAISALRERYPAQLRERALSERWRDTGLVFTNRYGEGFDPVKITLAFPAVVRAAGLPHIPLHGLRHTCAVFLLKSGVPLNTVSKMLRHKSIRTTADLYGHVLEEEKQEAAGRLDQLLGGVG